MDEFTLRIGLRIWCDFARQLGYAGNTKRLWNNMLTALKWSGGNQWFVAKDEATFSEYCSDLWDVFKVELSDSAIRSLLLRMFDFCTPCGKSRWDLCPHCESCRDCCGIRNECTARRALWDAGVVGSAQTG